MKWIRLGLMKTYSASSWRLRMKKMMPMMRPMKRREPAMPPMTAPVDGPGVIVLFSSATGERHIEEGKQRERERVRERFLLAIHLNVMRPLVAL